MPGRCQRITRALEVLSGPDHFRTGGLVGLEGASRAGVTDVGEEVVPFVIDQDVGGEVFYLDFPDSFHAELRIFQDFDLFDIVLGQDGGGAPNGSEVEATMFVTGIGDLLGAVAFGQHDHGGTDFLEGLDIGIHAAGDGGPKRPGGFAFRGLGRTRVVDGMVLKRLQILLFSLNSLVRRERS